MTRRLSELRTEIKLATIHGGGGGGGGSAEVNDLSDVVTWDNVPVGFLPVGTTAAAVAAGDHAHTGTYALQASAANWNTAFGWGDHAGLYADLSADETVTGAWEFTAITDFEADARLRSGSDLWLYDTGNTEYVRFLHDGSNCQIQVNGDGGKAKFQYTATEVDYLAGCDVRIRSSDNTDWLLMGHDLTDFNFDFTGTTDLNITGLTGAIQLSADLVATGDVTGANLNVSNWDTAFGWGDHSGVYALAASAANWNTAFGWGDHASGGYISEVTKASVEAVLTGEISSHTHAGGGGGGTTTKIYFARGTATDSIDDLSADLTWDTAELNTYGADLSVSASTGFVAMASLNVVFDITARASGTGRVEMFIRTWYDTGGGYSQDTMNVATNYVLRDSDQNTGGLTLPIARVMATGDKIKFSAFGDTDALAALMPVGTTARLWTP